MDTNIKVAIISGIIGVAGSMAVAFIGIVPNFYQKKIPTPEFCTLTGEITSEDAKPKKNAEIYLIRATGSELNTITDDNGKFTFTGVPDWSYWAVVRDTGSGQASRILIEKEKTTGELKVVESSLKYTKFKEGEIQK
jgi:hypothetical protein